MKVQRFSVVGVLRAVLLLAVLLSTPAALTGCGGGGSGGGSPVTTTTGSGGGGGSNPTPTSSPTTPPADPTKEWVALVNPQPAAKLAEIMSDPVRAAFNGVRAILDGALGSQFDAAYAADGQGGQVAAYVTTENSAATGRDIKIVAVNAQRQVGTPVDVCTAPGDQGNPAIGVDPTTGTIYVAWEGLGGDGKVHVFIQIFSQALQAQLTTNGVQLPAPRDVTPGNVTGQIDPQVAVTTFGDAAIQTREVGSVPQVLTYLVRSAGDSRWGGDQWRIFAEGQDSYSELSLTADDTGGFAVQGTAFSGDSVNSDIVGDYYLSDGTPQWETPGNPKVLSVLADGTTPAPRRQRAGAIAFSGGRFHLAMVDDRTGATQPSPTDGQELSDIVGLVVDKSGNFISPAEGKLLLGGTGVQNSISIAPNADGGVTVGGDDQGSGGHVVKTTRRNSDLSDAENATVIATVAVPPLPQVAPSDEANGGHVVFATKASNGRSAGGYEYVRPNRTTVHPNNGLNHEVVEGATEGFFSIVPSAGGTFINSQMEAGTPPASESRLYFRWEAR